MDQSRLLNTIFILIAAYRGERKKRKGGHASLYIPSLLLLVFFPVRGEKEGRKGEENHENNRIRWPPAFYIGREREKGEQTG